MTKLKNTKKGMAKKALSVSLVAAMLATSNVPVWAAEDLFSDGSAAVEAPVVEEPAAEVETFSSEPAEEVTADAPALQAVESQYNVEFKDLASSIEWGIADTVDIKIVDPVTNENVTNKMYVRYLKDGVQSDKYGTDIALSAYYDAATGYATLPITFAKEDVDGNFTLQVYERNNGAIGWNAVSGSFTVAKQEIEINTDISNLQNDNNTVRYTGSQITTVPEFTVSDVASSLPSGVSANDIEGFSNFVVTGEDTVNAVEYSGTSVNAQGDIVSDYYTGKINAKFYIWRKTVDSVDDAVKVELPTYTYQYTGSTITIPGEDITVTNKATNQVVEDAAQNLTIGPSIGDKSHARVNVDMTQGTLKNFVGSNDTAFGTEEAKPAEDIEITERDLADTANTKISIETVTQDLLQGSEIYAPALKNNLVITDADGNELSGLYDEVSFEFAGGADHLAVEAGGTYSVTIKGTTDNVINSRTVNFTVVAHDLNTANFDNEADYEKAVTYNGEKYTFGLTAANLTEKLGDLKDKNGTILSKETDYDVNVQFGENTNAGIGQIIINGKGGYAGSQKIITFTINQRAPKSGDNWLVVPEKVLYDASNVDGEDYDVETSVVAEFTENKKDYSLTVPAADYKVERKIVDANGAAAKNEVGNYVETTVTLTNENGNFDFTTFTKRSEIVNKAITESDVIMNETTYTYTGAEIIPDYTVVVGGVTLEKGVDYTEVVTHNVDVGEATLTITGMGDFDDTSVSKKFDIVAAQTSSVKVEANDNVVYNGSRHVNANELEITLNGNDVSDQFTYIFPTSKTSNINAGDGKVTLKPVKGNENFVGEVEFTFTIQPATLTGGVLNAYDENGTKVDIASTSFDYDGAVKVFAKTTYTNSGITSPMKLTSDDYEIIYADNVYGDSTDASVNGASGAAHILVVAKGNYKGGSTYTDANGNKIENVVLNQTFAIDKLAFDADDITVSNGSYKGGFDVEPDVTVSYKGKELVKDIDYKLVFIDSQDRTQVTNGKTLDVEIIGKGGYRREGNTSFKWGIDKFDFADADILVSGTDADPVVKVMNGSVLVDESEYDLIIADGKVTVTATEGNKNYEGSQTVDIEKELEKPGTPVITDVQVNGNNATVILAGETDGATGYDYVISTDRDCINNKDYDKVNKNILSTQTKFTYTQQGVYYAYCHAWKRVDGVKVFSDWSEAYPFSVTAITPEQPVITSVKKSGRNLTVTWTQSANATTGYDIVMGTEMRKVNGELRPVEYGKAVKKVGPNTFSVTFRSIPKGTYYVGLHAHNRTSETGVKVFSPWSNAKKVTF